MTTRRDVTARAADDQAFDVTAFTQKLTTPRAIGLPHDRDQYHLRKLLYGPTIRLTD